MYLLAVRMSFGGEDVCCDLKEENIEPIEDTKDGEFTHEEADDFVDRLKIYHIGFLVMPRTQMERIMKINVSTTPPFLLKAYRGEKLYNTEMKKNSAFLAAKQIRGSQQQLFDLTRKFSPPTGGFFLATPEG